MEIKLSEYREDLDGLLALAETIDREVARLNLLKNLFWIVTGMTFSVSISVMVVALEQSVKSGDSDIVPTALFLGSAIGCALAVWSASRAVRLAASAQTEAKILREILSSAHGILSTGEQQFRPVELQTYRMRLKRMSFNADAVK